VPKNVFNGAFVTSDGEVPSAARWNSLGLFGDGSDGSYTSGDNLTPGKVYNFTDFVLNSGDTLSSTALNSAEPIIIKVQGDAEINGTIDLKGNGYSATNGYGIIRDLGTFNDPKLRPVDQGTSGANGLYNDNEYLLGGAGGSAFRPEDYMNLRSGSLKVISGTGGGNGDGANGADGGPGGGGGASFDASGQGGEGGEFGDESSGNFTTAGVGGDGGGSFALFVKGNIDFQGTIDLRGNDGTDGEDSDGSGSGGGGGGGAGMAYVLYDGSLNDSGTKRVAGGSGGAGGIDTGDRDGDGGNGGNGANGTILFESVS